MTVCSLHWTTVLAVGIFIVSTVYSWYLLHSDGSLYYGEYDSSDVVIIAMGIVVFLVGLSVSEWILLVHAWGIM